MDTVAGVVGCCLPQMGDFSVTWSLPLPGGGSYTPPYEVARVSSYEPPGAYSPKCVEGEFSEVRLAPILGSTQLLATPKQHRNNSYRG